MTAVAGAVAIMGLYLLAAQEDGERAGRHAVVYLALFPYAVFMFAGYSEALFLAFATTAWLAARRDAWWIAGLLGAGASFPASRVWPSEWRSRSSTSPAVAGVPSSAGTPSR